MSVFHVSSEFDGCRQACAGEKEVINPPHQDSNISHFKHGPARRNTKWWRIWWRAIYWRIQNVLILSLVIQVESSVKPVVVGKAQLAKARWWVNNVSIGALNPHTTCYIAKRITQTLEVSQWLVLARVSHSVLNIIDCSTDSKYLHNIWENMLLQQLQGLLSVLK